MSDFITVTTREWKYSQDCVKIVEALKKLQTHPYNFIERVMESLQFEIEAKTKFRPLLAGLFYEELQKILVKRNESNKTK